MLSFFLVSSPSLFSSLISSSSPIDFVSRLFHWLSHFWHQPGSKRLITLFILFFSLVLAWRRIQHARQAEQRARSQSSSSGSGHSQRPRAADASSSHRSASHSNSPPPSSSSPASPRLPYSARYLVSDASAAGRAKPQVTISYRALFPSASPDSLSFDASSVRPSLISLLKSLSRSCSLFLVCHIPESVASSPSAASAAQESVRSSLASIGLFESGFLPHRLLFCSNSKGKQSFNRHIEPALCIDEDIETLKALKPFIPDCVLIDPASQADSNPVSFAAPGMESRLLRMPSIESLFGVEAKPPQQQTNNAS